MVTYTQKLDCLSIFTITITLDFKEVFFTDRVRQQQYSIDTLTSQIKLNRHITSIYKAIVIPSLKWPMTSKAQVFALDSSTKYKFTYSRPFIQPRSNRLYEWQPCYYCTNKNILSDMHVSTLICAYSKTKQDYWWQFSSNRLLALSTQRWVSDSVLTSSEVKVFGVFSSKNLLSTCRMYLTPVVQGVKEILSECIRSRWSLNEYVLLGKTNIPDSGELAKPTSRWSQIQQSPPIVEVQVFRNDWPTSLVNAETSNCNLFSLNNSQ